MSCSEINLLVSQTEREIDREKEREKKRRRTDERENILELE